MFSCARPLLAEYVCIGQVYRKFALNSISAFEYVFFVFLQVKSHTVFVEFWTVSSLILSFLIQKFNTASVPTVVIGPDIFFSLFHCLALKENRFIQAMILIVFHSSYFSRRSSNKFFSFTAIAKISFTGLSSAHDSTAETVVMSSGQSSCLDSHSGTFSHNCVDSSTLPPRLPKSAGF